MDKDTLEYVMQELNKFLTPEDIAKISVNEMANRPGIGFFRRNDKWFMYKNDDRMFTVFSGPYDSEWLVYELCLYLNRDSYDYSIEELADNRGKKFKSLKEIDDYTKPKETSQKTNSSQTVCDQTKTKNNIYSMKKNKARNTK